jgi:hypothetical protein
MLQYDFGPSLGRGAGLLPAYRVVNIILIMANYFTYVGIGILAKKCPGS